MVSYKFKNGTNAAGAASTTIYVRYESALLTVWSSPHKARRQRRRKASGSLHLPPDRHLSLRSYVRHAPRPRVGLDPTGPISRYNTRGAPTLVVLVRVPTPVPWLPKHRLEGREVV